MRRNVPFAILFAMFVLAALSSQTNGQIRTVALPATPIINSVDFSNDGSKLVVGGDSIRIYDANSGELVKRIKPEHMAISVAFSPADADTFAVGSLNGNISVWKLAQAEPVVVIKELLNSASDLTFSPDGRLIVGCDSVNKGGEYSARLKVFDAETGKTLRSVELDGEFASAIAFSEDGQLLVVGTGFRGGRDSKVHVVSLDSWEITGSIPFGPGFARSISISPTNEQFVICGAEQVEIGPGATKDVGKVWVADNKEEQTSRLLIDGFSGFRSTENMPDKDSFVATTELIGTSANGLQSWVAPQIQLRKLSDGEVIWSYESPPGFSQTPQLSHDKKRVACCLESSVVILDAKTGALEKRIFVNE